MSAAFFIVIKNCPEDFDPFVNGKKLSSSDHEVTSICKSIGVKPLMEFFSQDSEEVREFIESEGGDADELDLPDEVWFPASEGLVTVRALIAHFEDEAHKNKDLMRDLKEYECVLETAEERGLLWHLAIDF